MYAQGVKTISNLKQVLSLVAPKSAGLKQNIGARSCSEASWPFPDGGLDSLKCMILD